MDKMKSIINSPWFRAALCGAIAAALLVSLSILAEVIFGTGVFGTNVVANVMELIKSLGDGGFVGLIALVILIQVFQKKG